MQFYKMHGCGNDFVLVDARAQEERDWHALARALCDRHFGVGSDGLLLVLDSAVADYRMRMFNTDGSEAEMCGNGIRCFARYVYEKVRPVQTLDVETLAGTLRLVVHVADGRAGRVTVSMGKPRLAAREIPVALDGSTVIDHPLGVGGREMRFTAVSMGNPHAVVFLDEDPDTFPLEDIGPKVEHHPLFPKLVNFEVARIASRGEVKMRVWERGVGLTLACGSGACAVAVAARLKGLTDDRILLRLPGGNLELEWDGQGEVKMTGPAEFVFAGTWLGGNGTST